MKTIISQQQLQFAKVYKTKKHIQAPLSLFNNGYLGKLICSVFSLIEYHHIELIRRFLIKVIQKKGDVRRIISLTRFLTKKSDRSRMGKGVGKFHKVYSFVQPGTVLFEIKFKDLSVATKINKSLRFLHKKIRFKCLFIVKSPFIDLKNNNLYNFPVFLNHIKLIKSKKIYDSNFNHYSYFKFNINLYLYKYKKIIFFVEDISVVKK